jgi:hypothetical protein
MPEESAIGVEPRVSEVKIGATLIGTFDAIANRLATLQMFSIKVNPDGIILARVESRDIQKRPFLFHIITLYKDRLTAEYTIAPDSSEKLRKLYIIKTVMGLLSLIVDLYSPNSAELFQYTDSSIDDVLNSMSQSYSTLFNNYDSLFNEYRELKRLNIELTAANKNLDVQTTQLSSDNEELKARLKSLETYSDESLMVMVQEWIEAHNNTIDINEFANNYKITPPRVEQILNKLVTQGYIEVRG